MPPEGHDAASHFVAKWLEREPEMQFATLFCAPEQRPRFQAWGGLLHELREALFELSDARVSGVKRGWWAEEMFAMDSAAPRHPLTQALAGSAAPWRELGRALLGHGDSADRPMGTESAIEPLLRVAGAVIAVEAALFDARASSAAGEALAIHWLLHRLPRGLANEDQARIPMHLFARHGLTAAQVAAGQGEALLRDWSTELRQRLPPALPGAALASRARLRFDRARLVKISQGGGFSPPAPHSSLWSAWRAARTP